MNGRLEYIDSVGVKHTLEFDGSEPVWVGRRSECAVHNLDENLSREHCWIERERPGGDFVIQDNASRAGTYVNGQSIDAYTLTPGDVIQCASLSLSFSIAAEGGAGDADAVGPLRARIAELQQALERLDNEAVMAYNAQRIAEEEARQWRDEESKLSAQVERLEARLRERDEQRSAEDDASGNMQDVIAEYEAQVKQAQQEARELAEELEEARDKLAKQRDKLDKQKQDLARQRKEIDEFANERDELWAKLKAEKENSESLQNIVDHQEKMVTALRESAVERDKLIQELRSGR